MHIARIHEERLGGVSDPVLQEYLDAKKAHDLAGQRLKQAEAALLVRMQEKHQKSYKHTQPDGSTTTVTYVQRNTVEIDEKGLRRALTAKVFDKYTVKKLDRKAMEAAMDTGAVDPMTVARFVTEKPSQPYLKYTYKEGNDDA